MNIYLKFILFEFIEFIQSKIAMDIIKNGKIEIK